MNSMQKPQKADFEPVSEKRNWEAYAKSTLWEKKSRLLHRLARQGRKAYAKSTLLGKKSRLLHRFDDVEEIFALESPWDEASPAKRSCLWVECRACTNHLHSQYTYLSQLCVIIYAVSESCVVQRAPNPNNRRVTDKQQARTQQAKQQTRTQQAEDKSLWKKEFA